MLRFVILTHDHPHLHWDFLMETSPGDALRSWRLEHPPEHNESIRAEPLPEHRRIYLDYEGAISGNRGVVKQWDSGEVTVLSESDDEMLLELNGQRVAGVAHFRRDPATDAWWFQWSKQERGAGSSASD